MGHFKSQLRAQATRACLPAGVVVLALVFVLSCRTRARPNAATAVPSFVDTTQPLPVALSPMPTAKGALEEGMAAWPQRDERASLDKALGAFERAFLLSPIDADVAARLAHGYFLLGHLFLREAHDTAAMQKAFGRGVVVAEMGLRLASATFAARLARGEAVEDAIDALEAPAIASLVAYTENIGVLSALRGKASGLFFAERLRACIEKLLAMDEQYARALPHRFMALWFERVPSFAGGSHKQAQAHFQAALTLSHNALENVVAAAEYSAKPAAYDELLRQWAKTPLPAPPPPADDEIVSGAAEYRIAERLALKRLDRVAAR